MRINYICKWVSSSSHWCFHGKYIHVWTDQMKSESPLNGQLSMSTCLQQLLFHVLAEGQSIHPLLFKPLYKNHLPTTEMVLDKAHLNCQKLITYQQWPVNQQMTSGVYKNPFLIGKGHKTWSAPHKIGLCFRFIDISWLQIIYYNKHLKKNKEKNVASP